MGENNTKTANDVLFLRGGGNSGLVLLSLYITFVKLEFSMLRHAISDEDGS